MTLKNCVLELRKIVMAHHGNGLFCYKLLMSLFVYDQRIALYDTSYHFFLCSEIAKLKCCESSALSIGEGSGESSRIPDFLKCAFVVKHKNYGIP